MRRYRKISHYNSNPKRQTRRGLSAKYARSLWRAERRAHKQGYRQSSKRALRRRRYFVK